MAVKQNNTETNGPTTGTSGQMSAGNTIKTTTTGTKAKNLNGLIVGKNGDGDPKEIDIEEMSGCSGNLLNKPMNSQLTSIASNSPLLSNDEDALPVHSSKQSDISYILNLIEIVELRQQQMDLGQDIFKIYKHIILKLAVVQIPRQSDELKCFKENITKVGTFFAKANDQLVYKFYLHLVCQLITMSDNDSAPPSCALAIIFQLFSSDMIFEAVQSLLERDIPDNNIRKTVTILCDWLRICMFCQNLNLWIMAILNNLQKQHKILLFDQVALDNIEHLFASLIVPILRPKVAPIVFYMLSCVDQRPNVFHKILPRFPLVLNMLKQQSNSTEEYAQSTQMLLQELVNQTSALMVRFYGYHNLYEPIEKLLKSFQPSLQYPLYNSMENCDGMLYIRDKSENSKVGLVNLGNTCYMNSVLQALAMTKQFSREILLSDSKSPLIMKFQQQIALMLYSIRHELTPSKVLNATRPPGFSPGFQQDSSEFLGYLLETLHEQELAFLKNAFKESGIMNNKAKKIPELGASAAICTQTSEQEANYQDEKESDDMNTTSPSSNPNNKDTPVLNSTIEKTFTGKLATTYKCLTCGYKSCNIDSFRDLQLSFPDVKNDCASNYSVQDLIEYYCSPEKLDGDNKYFCKRCKMLSDAERYINVITAPKNLILTLKHFKYDQKCHTRSKLMHKVFHDEKVSLKVFTTETLKEVAAVHYDLYAGVVHSGFSMDSGHYYTYAADATNKWYKFNDSIVTPTKTEELHNLSPPNTPYILFYQMGARSHESLEASESTKVIKVDVPVPLLLEELPEQLQELVNDDNYAFREEIKMKNLKNTNHNVMYSSSSLQNKPRRNSFDNDDEEDDDDGQPPTAGCGDNALNININRFIF